MIKHTARNRTERILPAYLLSAAGQRKARRAFIAACLVALVLSAFAIHIETQSILRKSCASVSEGFTSIMRSYEHSFVLFEKLLQREILHTGDPDAIEAFLKEQDTQLLAIEGGDYDGVYMYYQGRYLYSWDTPYAVYRDSGYDATTRPWYIGAVAAKGALFFSVPYPSYANDYMLSTISRLQPDGQTVIAYDIKLGAIGEYVDKLDMFTGALTLICDDHGNIIGSTEHLYLGGNYTRTDAALSENIALAQREADVADDSAREKAEFKLRAARAQQAFCWDTSAFLERLRAGNNTLRYALGDFTFGYAHDNGEYTCFVLAPITSILPKAAIVWAALSFFIMLCGILFVRMAGRSNQILTDALTGLNNRRALMKYCNNHIAHRPDDNITLIMLDLDDFKQINDKSGHMAGDHALLDTADALKKACAQAPRSFFLCRYGGDEFLLAGACCDETDIAQTRALIADQFAIKNSSGANPYTLKASIGVASGKCVKSSDLERLLERADKAMYDEKMRAR